MSDSPGPKPPRPWRIVAEEAAHEYDARNMADLIRELNLALKEQRRVDLVREISEKKSA